ncbi:MAG TPA: hypothetical protein DHV36_08665 [Desulfobacteraceae bacterium]|nr:hypothetical protein [Desulfobacteraceae bacterium]
MKFEDINQEMLGDRRIYKAVKSYIQEKNLNIIVSGGKCINLRQDTLAPGELDTLLDEFAACGFCRVSFNGDKPAPPFLAAKTDKATGRARVVFLLDLTEEAKDGKASKFYSKILGALTTQVFAVCPEMYELWFPFELEETVGRGLTLSARGTDMAIVKAQPPN